MFVLTMALLLLQAAPDDAKVADQAIEKFKKDFKGTEDQQIAAVKALGEVNHPKVINKLSTLASGGSPKIKVASVTALGAFTKEKTAAGAALLAALNANLGERGGVVWSILEALGTLKEPASVPGLVPYFDNKDTDIASRAVQAAGKIGSTTAVESLIAALLKAEKALKANSSTYTANNTQSGTSNTYTGDPNVKQRAETMIKVSQQALRDITKQNLTTSTEWTEWWALNKPAPNPKK
jgi:HEAT repeat protein